jgi:hypothetical protein
MKHILLQRWAVAGAAAVGLLFASPLPAATVPADQVRQVGPTVVLYQGPQVQVAVSYRFPKLNLGGTWLMLDTTMAATAAPLEIPRAAISLHTPDGEIVPLATPDEYDAAYPRLAWDIIKDEAIRDPLGLSVPRPVRALRFFAPGGMGLGFDAEWLDYWHARTGRLFFDLPGGVQEGHYQLVLDLPESKAVIPFTL